eukprot:759517-Hanusia_phi.AAC.6
MQDRILVVEEGLRTKGELRTVGRCTGDELTWAELCQDPSPSPTHSYEDFGREGPWKLFHSFLESG